MIKKINCNEEQIRSIVSESVRKILREFDADISWPSNDEVQAAQNAEEAEISSQVAQYQQEVNRKRQIIEPTLEQWWKQGVIEM